MSPGCAAARRRGAVPPGKDPARVTEPGTVDYARSFFPVALVVLLLRSFIFEPFRIPSDSMMPTLLDGDFIIVNKFTYGLRLPVLNRKIVDRSASRSAAMWWYFAIRWIHPMNYIKRLVGLPGDHVEIRNDRLIINGQPVPFKIVGPYNDGCYINLQLADEHLGAHDPSGHALPGAARHDADARQQLQPARVARLLSAPTARTILLRSCLGVPRTVVKEVPPGMYLMMGDNRDNSEDGRVWGFVPEDQSGRQSDANLVQLGSEAFGRPELWSRIGSAHPNEPSRNGERRCIAKQRGVTLDRLARAADPDGDRLIRRNSSGARVSELHEGVALAGSAQERIARRRNGERAGDPQLAREASRHPKRRLTRR